ncbi:YhjD/YihY/BrkB family envelope integrity protein [Actinacidiphila rubida]|uniref:Virulence factor BrkB n=1 Tax=Actinacidiphila rubida TaxID=310780 RepID=A0A1H8TJ15_9ACTN|nr:YhjD/YihY/BrkB family envelope integrity protein [Actinacidiphila rubida]SEO91069.1 Virulence factor BrkB [Actinacidiphila rubida]
MAEREPERGATAHGASRAEQAPGKPSDLPRGSSREILKRTFREYKADNLPDLAAALTYYAILAIFPALLALVSIVACWASRQPSPLPTTSPAWHLVPSAPR